MHARRTAARFTLTAALVGGLALAGAVVPASAVGEPDGLYSATGEDGVSGFVQLDKTDATPTPLGAGSEDFVFFSVEVVNGVGFATGLILGTDDESDEDDVYAVFTWNIATGAVLTAVPLTSSHGAVDDVSALDTLGDGTLLAYAEFEDLDDEWISSINPTTGVVTPLVNVDLVEDNRIFEGLATNPVDGITYALADYDNGYPAYSPVDFATGTIGESVVFEDIHDSIGPGWFSEGDFDSTGVLWFTYSGEVGVARTDGPAEVGVEGIELGDPDIESKAITIGQTAVYPVPVEPQLAATGFPVAPVIGGAAALLLAGAGLLVVRRRATA